MTIRKKRPMNKKKRNSIFLLTPNDFDVNLVSFDMNFFISGQVKMNAMHHCGI